MNAGVVTGVAVGTATISATSEGKSGTATINVTLMPVATVVVSPAAKALLVTQTFPLGVTVTDSAGTVVTDRVVTWGSSNTAVATVSAAGVVTAVATGTATITATSEGKSGSSTITVSPVPVSTVAVQPPTNTLAPGATVQLTAIAKDSAGGVLTGRAVGWASSDPAVATVSVTGLVTAVALGNATITASSEGKSGTAAVTIAPVPVGSVTVAPPSATVRMSQTATLTATVKDSVGTVVTNRPVAWSSSNPAIATVNAGVVTGVAVGTATISATSEGKSGTATINVTLMPVATVVVSPATKAMLVTQTFPLGVTVTDSVGTVVTDRVVTWGSSNTAVATVSAAGVVTAVAAGTATITATSEGKSGSSTITVSPVPVSTVAVQPPTDSLAPGATVQLTAIAKDSAGGVLTGRAVGWASSDPAVATVSVTGLVTGVAVGNATMTATSEGKSGTSVMTVYIPVASVAVAPPTATILLTQTKAFTATATDATGNLLTGRLVTWSSSNPAIATVNSSGVATGVALGTVTITATSEGKSGSATLTINPVPVFSVTITPPSPDTVFVNYTTQLAAVTQDSAGNVLTGRAVTWQSNDPGIATVGATGLVTGVAAGNTNIVATSEGKSGSNTLMSIPAPVGSVTLAPNVDSVTTSGSTSTKTIMATVRDVQGTVVTDRVVNWTSTPGAIATVSPSSGASTTVTGASVGQAQVIATSTKADTASIKVMLAVTSVTISPATATLSLATTPTVQLTATAENGGTTITGRAITWSSDNTSVATVDATGKVTAIAAGTANITATVVFDGVTSAIPAIITVTP